jgi:hypothetical protein
MPGDPPPDPPIRDGGSLRAYERRHGPPLSKRLHNRLRPPAGERAKGASDVAVDARGAQLEVVDVSLQVWSAS